MKHIFLTLLLTLLLLLTGCGELTPEAASAAMETAEIPYSAAIAERLSGWSIVRSDLASGNSEAGSPLLSAYSKLRRAVGDAIGADMPPVTDWVKRGEAVPEDLPEILVGETNRAVSGELQERITSYRENHQNDFIVKIEGDKIALAGGSDAALEAAADWFIIKFLEPGKALPESYEFVYRKPYRERELCGVSIAEWVLRPTVSLHPDIRAELDALYSDIYADTGFKLKEAAADAPAAAHEIIVALDGAADAWAVCADGNQVKITGGSYAALTEGVREFAAAVRKSSMKRGFSRDGVIEYQIPLTREGGYTLVWHDEFDGELNESYWVGTDTTVEGHNGGVVYRRWVPENVRTEDGNLVINAYKLDTPNDFETSPHCKTQNRMKFMYGYLEMYAKIPTDKGVWPAWWLNSGGLGYEIAPEIDIFEVFGSHKTLVANVHKWGAEHTSLDGVIDKNDRAYIISRGKLSDEYHHYAFDWDEEYMRFYFDGELYYKHKMDDDLRKELYIIISMLVGAINVDAPDATTRYPVEYRVDWIRLYQKENGVVTFGK